LVAIVLAAGCAPLWPSKPAPDPLEGWSSLGSITWNGLKTPGEHPPPLPEAITKDYEDYIRKLPDVRGHFATRSGSFYIDRIEFYEDGAGRRAVAIRMPVHGVEWRHVLFYDRAGKRIRAVKYESGHYAS
jgi:hypothetical protein